MSGSDEKVATSAPKGGDDSSRPTGSSVRSRILLGAVLALAVLGVVYFYFSSQPPDLSNCTRLEIRYYPSTLEYFFPLPKLTSVLSGEEKTHIESLATLTVSHGEWIGDFAAQISQGS
jgi:hypothetical protein